MEVLNLFNGLSLLSVGLTFLFIHVFFFNTRIDFTIFISLNFSIIINWIFLTSFYDKLLKFVILFILIFLLFYHTKSSADRLISRFLLSLKRDFSIHLIFLSLCNFFLILVPSIGLDQISAREANFEAQSSFAYRILSYFLLTQSILVSLVIEQAVNRGSWHRREKIAMIIIILNSLVSLSRAGILYPALIYFLCKFNNGRKIKPILIFFLVLAVLPIISSRLFPDMSYINYLQMILIRIINNVDVIFYLETLKTFEYPFTSMFYLAWPLYHITQTNFVVPGVWIFSGVTGNTSGFGPNPTFIVDFILASNLSGLLLAAPLARLLKLSTKSYPITGSALTFTILQDWYLSCTILAVLFMFIIGMKLRIKL